VPHRVSFTCANLCVACLIADFWICLAGLRDKFNELKAANFSAWVKRQALQYTFVDFPIDAGLQSCMRDVCTALVAQGAFSASASSLVPPHLKDWNAVLARLAEHKMVESSGDNNWHLTRAGLAKLDYGNRFNVRISVTGPRPDWTTMALNDLTNFELLHKLEDATWRWLPLPSPKKRPDPFHYLVESAELVWYGGFDRSYVLALLEVHGNPPKAIANGVTAVGHNRDKQYYQRLLKDIRNEGARRRHLVIDDLEADGVMVLDSDDLGGGTMFEDDAVDALELTLEEELGLLLDEAVGSEEEGREEGCATPSPRSSVGIGVRTPLFAGGAPETPPPLPPPPSPSAALRPDDPHASDDKEDESDAEQEHLLFHGYDDVYEMVTDELNLNEKSKLEWGVFLFTYSVKATGAV
jgi:hypothetical protein